MAEYKKQKKPLFKYSPQLLMKSVIIFLIFIFLFIKYKERILGLLFAVVILAINGGLGWLNSKVRGVNIEIFSLGCTFFATFYKGTTGLLFILAMLISYFFFSGFNFWNIPYFLGSLITYSILMLFPLSNSLFWMGTIIVITNLITYVFFSFFHGNLIRPLKDTSLGIMLNLLLLNMFYPLIRLI